jgi:hypothetical protein
MRFRQKVRWGLASILAGPILLAFIAIVRVAGALSSFPVAVGRRLNVASPAHTLVNRLTDVEVAYTFRDELLYLMEEQVYRTDIETDEFDRWGLLRQIDRNREAAIEDLQTGEFVFSVGGSVLSIALGLWVDIRYAGIGLALIAIGFSILVVLRVVVTDLLSYRSHEVRNDSIPLLVLKRGWNETQINHGSSLLFASVLITASSSDFGYALGMRIVERLGTLSNPSDNDRYSADGDTTE